MATGQLVYWMIARHGQAIERLRRDMLEAEHGTLVELLSHECANFVYAYLVATGNAVTPQDRTLRNDVQAAIIEALGRHGIDEQSFRLWPDVEPPGQS